MPYHGIGIGPKGPIWGMVKAIGLGVTLIIRTREDTASPGRPDYTARRMAEFNLWLLILGIAAGAAVTWLVIGTIARNDDEIASSEAAAGPAARPRRPRHGPPSRPRPRWSSPRSGCEPDGETGARGTAWEHPATRTAAAGSTVAGRRRRGLAGGGERPTPDPRGDRLV